MPSSSSLLRALTQRSTPTLPSEQSERHKNVRMVLTPSIFITLPLEEGGHFWCVYPGSACPMPLPVPSPTTNEFDVPLPDIAAIEDTVDRLRRAGESPTFKRPTKPNEVILPKKKYIHAHGHEHKHGFEDSMTVPIKGWSKRPKTPPIDYSMAEDDKANDGKKKRKSRPPPLTSISYESIVSQPFSPTSPEAFHVSMSKDTEPRQKEKKRNSLGWLFSSSKRSSVRKETTKMGGIVESEPLELAQAQFAVRRDDDAEVTLDQVMESTLPNSPGAESTHTTATFESDLDKPLPPLPPSKSIQQQMQGSQVANEMDLTLARYPSRGQPRESVEERQQQKDSSESARPSTPSKIKRKFSLKKLRERFIPSPAPPVPELPNPALTQAGNKPTAAIVGIAGVPPEPIDPPFTPPPIPSLDSVPREFPVVSSNEVDAIESTSSSGPIDPLFTPPSVPESSHALETETVIAPPLLLKDEEPDLSTASEDSTNTTSSATSTPESSPPDTPANVDFGPIFGMDQDAGAIKSMPLDMLPSAAVEKIEVALTEGMTRSNGIRTKLASLHFDNIEFDTSAF